MSKYSDGNTIIATWSFQEFEITQQQNVGTRTDNMIILLNSTWNFGTPPASRSP